MESSTPGPMAAAKAIPAKPSRTDLMTSSRTSPVNPSWMDPSTVRGPTQKTRLAVTKARLMFPCARTLCPAAEGLSARLRRASNQCPRPSSLSSIRQASPSTPPASTLPMTINTLPVFSAICRPTSSVTSPSPCITVSRVRVGSRSPSSAPIEPPMITAAMLTNVPLTDRSPRALRLRSPGSAALSRRHRP